jgi:hypothetical protein
VQWPPTRTDQPLPPPTAGTFDGLHISPQYPPAQPPTTLPSAPVLVHQSPSWTSHVPIDPRSTAPYGQPIFPRHRRQRSVVVIPPAICNNQPALAYLAPAPSTATYALVPAQETYDPLPQDPPHPAGISRTLSIDAIAFSSAPPKPTVTRVACPKPLTVTEKVMAFLGNDQLLAQHSLRQTIKRGLSSSSC